jgi:hypothetical protein
LKILYYDGFLNAIPTYVFNSSNQFWKCFQQSLEENKTGHDGKIRILSIIANNFKYEVLQKNLKVNEIIAHNKTYNQIFIAIVYSIQVSSKTIAKARHHCKVNGPGCPVINKPIITRV